jgi:hypothetical protein
LRRDKPPEVGVVAMFELRRIALASASSVIALAALTCGGSGQALALSAGCTAIGSGSVAASTTIGVNAAVGTGFNAGETITASITGTAGFVGIELDDLTTTTALAGGGHFVAPGANSFTYTFPAAPTDTIAIWEVSGVGPQTVTWSCTGSANPDSQKIRSLQNSVTPLVANISGQNITNAIDGGINDAFSPNGTPTSFGPDGGFINFAAEPKSEIASKTDEAFSALGYAGGTNKAPDFNKAPPRLDREWSAWADIRGTGWKVNDTTGTGNNLTGNQINLTAGLGRKLNTDTLVGVIVGYEYFKYDVAALAGSLKGNGETIGGYFSRRLTGTLRFDAALGWTYVNYNATAGAATGSFHASRWLASTGLTGTYKVNVYTLEPSAKVYALWESENAWTDSLGTAQASRNFSAGRTALGAIAGRPFEASNGWTVTPSAGLYGDWRFQTDNALPTGTPVANIGTGWSGRVTAGLAAKAAHGCMVSLDGEYGGLGASYKIWTGSVRASMPF